MCTEIFNIISLHLKNDWTLKISRADGIKIYDMINTLNELIFFIIIDKYKNFFICRIEKTRMEKKWITKENVIIVQAKNG